MEYRFDSLHLKRVVCGVGYPFLRIIGKFYVKYLSVRQSTLKKGSVLGRLPFFKYRRQILCKVSVRQSTLKKGSVLGRLPFLQVSMAITGNSALFYVFWVYLAMSELYYVSPSHEINRRVKPEGITYILYSLSKIYNIYFQSTFIHILAEKKWKIRDKDMLYIKSASVNLCHILVD